MIINNYNYERYLGEAIRSALSLTGVRTEVIVVDDGSQDGSRAIIESFGNQIVPIFKENGGQASAMNAGVRNAHGDAILFLDADDVLLDGIGFKVRETFEQEPSLAKVQFRLKMVDGDGQDRGVVIPPEWQPMPNGDLRDHIVRHRTYVYPPTSGNAFSRRAIDLMGEIPEDVYRISADQFLHHAAPITGTVRSLDEVGGWYRVHSSNHYASSSVDLRRLRNEIIISQQGHSSLKKLADRTGLYAYPEDYLAIRDRILLGMRLTSLKLDPENHPVSGDSLLRLCFHGFISTLRTPGSSPVRKSIQALWFVIVTVAPRPIAREFIERRTGLANPGSDDNGRGQPGRFYRVTAWIMRKSGRV